MKKSRFIIAAVPIIAAAYVYTSIPSKVDADSISGNEKARILSQVISSAVHADVTDITSMTDAGGKTLCSLRKGDKVEVLRDRDGIYLVREIVSNREGWIPAEYLDIETDETISEEAMTSNDKEGYAKIMRFKSDTDYFVWVDLSRQEVNIFTKYENLWRLANVIPCSSGLNTSPTPRGYFTLKNRGEWFFSERLGSGAKYWVRFDGSYLFHSVAMDKEQNVIDDTIGKRHSSGCVRMSVENSKWFYDTIPDGTNVFIN